jgi:YtcA family
MKKTKLPAAFFRIFGLAILLPLTGCRGAPSVNILGSYFPGWMLCAFLGVFGSYVCRQIFVMTNVDSGFVPRPLVYFSLWVLLTLSIWLLFFRN